ncbi:hypothetical protein KCU61_g676, partial [Aureobasidium melanogenum]
MFVDAVGGWRPNWMKDSGVVDGGGEEEEDGVVVFVSDGDVRLDVMYSSTKSKKFLPKGLVSRAVSANNVFNQGKALPFLAFLFQNLIVSSVIIEVSFVDDEEPLICKDTRFETSVRDVRYVEGEAEMEEYLASMFETLQGQITDTASSSLSEGMKRLITFILSRGDPDHITTSYKITTQKGQTRPNPNKKSTHFFCISLQSLFSTISGTDSKLSASSIAKLLRRHRSDIVSKASTPTPWSLLVCRGGGTPTDL